MIFEWCFLQSLVALLHSLHTHSRVIEVRRGALYPCDYATCLFVIRSNRTNGREWEPSLVCESSWAPLLVGIYGPYFVIFSLFFNIESLINVNLFYFNSIFLFVFLFDIFFLFCIFSSLVDILFFLLLPFTNHESQKDILSFYYSSICFVVESKNPLVQSCTFSFCVYSHCQKHIC